MSPVGVDPQAQHTRPQMISHSRNISQTSPPMSVGQPDTTDPKSAVSAGMGSRASRLPSVYYPSPFQKHYDQLGTLSCLTNVRRYGFRINTHLEQEYDAQADMIDDEHESSVGTSPFVPGFNHTSSVANAPHAMNTHGLNPYNHPSSGEGVNGAYGNTNAILGNYEPMLDSDPFGLSASMHFQTPFSYEQSNARQ